MRPHICRVAYRATEKRGPTSVVVHIGRPENDTSHVSLTLSAPASAVVGHRGCLYHLNHCGGAFFEDGEESGARAHPHQATLTPQPPRFTTFRYKIHSKIGSLNGKPGFTKKQADLFFPPDFADDFPVAMQISQKYGLIYVITKLGLLFVYDLETATAVYRNRISPDPIFLTTEASAVGGFYAVNRKGQVPPATVNEAAIVPFVSGQLNNLELAVNLAKRGNLSGTENLISGFAADNIIKVLQGERVGTLFHQKASSWVVPNEDEAREMAVSARECSRRLQKLSAKDKKKILLDIADALEVNQELIKIENAADVAVALLSGYKKSLISRLTMKPRKISSLSKSIRVLADMGLAFKNQFVYLQTWKTQ